MEYGLLIDYKYCTGCHTCEVACQKEHGLDSNEFGIALHQIGPDQISNRKWQYDFFPAPTDRCDLCANRVGQGKVPSCVKHCQAGCMEYGEIGDLAARMTSDHMALFR